MDDRNNSGRESGKYVLAVRHDDDDDDDDDYIKLTFEILGILSSLVHYNQYWNFLKSFFRQ